MALCFYGFMVFFLCLFYKRIYSVCGAGRWKDLSVGSSGAFKGAVIYVHHWGALNPTDFALKIPTIQQDTEMRSRLGELSLKHD